MQKQLENKKETILHLSIVLVVIIALSFLGYTVYQNNFSNDNTNQNEQEIYVYFGKINIQPENKNCLTVFPVTRTVAESENIEEVALQELFKGTTIVEEEKGLHTDISPEFSIKKLSIENGTATVTLHNDLELLGHTACQATTIKTQITKTLEQFPNINNVVITTIN